MIENIAILLAASYCFGAFLYWVTHRKPDIKLIEPKAKDVKRESIEFSKVCICKNGIKPIGVLNGYVREEASIKNRRAI